MLFHPLSLILRLLLLTIAIGLCVDQPIYQLIAHIEIQYLLLIEMGIVWPFEETSEGRWQIFEEAIMLFFNYFLMC